MNQTKIEWCDYTWNPVTGCLHNCEYCYARGIARRFGGRSISTGNYLDGNQKFEKCCKETKSCRELDAPMAIERQNGKFQFAPFPYVFDPTFYRYRLEQPAKMKKPQNIFVCDMADLFGEWVPDEWISEVFKACEAAPQHRYLFLTKNPERLVKLRGKHKLPNLNNFWYGTTINNPDNAYFYDRLSSGRNVFLSAEPLLKPFDFTELVLTNWMIIGAETGDRKGKIIPKREWVENIVKSCRERDIPVFMKGSLIDIWGESLIQEFPWEVAK
ncbi:MAG: phage Gp37/Gp68 family protein [Clostridiales bacterium]|nr:phage Gp37/Gp68 family protein [Clostridiales bacterium]